MTIYVDYNGELKHWFYYYYDSANFKSTTEGFKNHILAVTNAKERLGDNIKVLYK